VHSLSNNNRSIYLDPFKRAKVRDELLGGKRTHCAAGLQDMASEVFTRPHLKGCHCRPACLLVGSSVWLLSTIVSYSGYDENLSRSSAKAGNV